VPIGSATIGTVIRRASTTETSGGGGTRSAPARDEQPEIAAEAQAAPRAIQHRVPGLTCLTGAMVLSSSSGSGRTSRHGRFVVGVRRHVEPGVGHHGCTHCLTSPQGSGHVARGWLVTPAERPTGQVWGHRRPYRTTVMSRRGTTNLLKLTGGR